MSPPRTVMARWKTSMRADEDDVDLKKIQAIDSDDDKDEAKKVEEKVEDEIAKIKQRAE